MQGNSKNSSLNHHVKNSVIDQGKNCKWVSQRNWTDRECHVQYINNLVQTFVNISFTTTQLSVLPICGPRSKLHWMIILRKHYHLGLYPKLCYGKFAIQFIPCACVEYNHFFTRPGTLVCPMFNNSNTKMLLTAHNGLCWEPLKNGTQGNLPIKIYQVSNFIILIGLHFMATVKIWNNWYSMVNMVL